jgi:hypothetical protein
MHTGGALSARGGRGRLIPRQAGRLKRCVFSAGARRALSEVLPRGRRIVGKARPPPSATTATPAAASPATSP